MSSSEFNATTSFGFDEEQKILLPIESKRFIYYKTRKYGLLQFVKKPKPEYLHDLVTLKALHKEFSICYPLSHPSLVRYTSLDGDTLYEEYIDGKTLKEMFVANDPRLSEEGFIESVSRQLFECLEYLHRNGILHLDIKPENLMITNSGNNLKLIDFGCAVSSVDDSTPGFTEEYKAPEQGTASADCTTDIYLAGNVVKQLLAFSKNKKIWRRFVEKATAPEPADRYRSATEAIKAFPNEKRIKKFYGLIAAFSGLILATALVVFLFLSPDKVNDEVDSSSDLSMISDANPKDSLALQTENNEITKQEDIEIKKQPTKEIPELTQTRTDGNLSSEAKGAAIERKPTVDSSSDSETVKKDIKKEVDKIYRRVLEPVVNDEQYPEGWMSPGGQGAFQKALKQTQDEVLTYGKRMAEKHPGQKDEIEALIISLINNKNLIYLQRFNVN